jgi:hypothetical protein
MWYLYVKYQTRKGHIFGLKPLGVNKIYGHTSSKVINNFTGLITCGRRQDVAHRPPSWTTVMW